jgi:uncharacterized 2Fe-2S/4Fe-4S cluster protein (DUF4445 family)
MEPAKNIYALAVDLGTTTVKVSLLDLPKKKSVARIFGPNKQNVFGEEVISRIDFCLREKKNLARLSRLAVDSIEALARGLCEEKKVLPSSIAEVLVVGNPTMQHILLRKDVARLVNPPYTLSFKGVFSARAKAVGFRALARARLTVMPSIDGHAGSDLLAGVLRSGIYKKKSPCVLIDIGTNGELALAVRGKIFATSTAAGPAFEGIGLSCGTNFRRGAVYKVSAVKGALRFLTVGGGPARGICGSGYIDLLRVLLTRGVLHADGALETEKFFITHTPALYITRHDIRKLQLSKAALRAGLETLLEIARVKKEAVSRFIITGSFGSFLDKNALLAIGLLPKVPARKISVLHDAALGGAEQCVLHKKSFLIAKGIAPSIQYIRLLGKSFKDAFVNALSFT